MESILVTLVKNKMVIYVLLTIIELQHYQTLVFQFT